jgi:hypothetical protein
MLVNIAERDINKKLFNVILEQINETIKLNYDRVNTVRVLKYIMSS